MAKQKDVYVVIFYPALGKAFCLNRSYDILPDDDTLWKKIKMGDIIETDKEFFPPLAILPNWVTEAESVGYTRVACWTNYYEPKKADPYCFKCLICETLYTASEFKELETMEHTPQCSNCLQAVSWMEVK